MDIASWTPICCSLFPALVIVWGIVLRFRAQPTLEHLDVKAADESLDPNNGHGQETLMLERSGLDDAGAEVQAEQPLNDLGTDFESQWHEWLDLALPPGGDAPEE